jgi:hypothetical protein
VLAQSEVLLITISENIAYEDYAQYFSVVDYRTAVFIYTFYTETTPGLFAANTPFEHCVATAITRSKSVGRLLCCVAYRTGMDPLRKRKTGFFVAVVIQEDNTDVKIYKEVFKKKSSTSKKNVEGNRKIVLEKAVKKAFPPEFINRVDEQIFFNPLTKEDIGHIIDIELKGLKKRVKEAGFELVITTAAKRFVADAGFDPSFGARPLERAIRKYIENPVSEHIISNKMFGGITHTEARKLRISLSKDKESTVVEWR